MTIALRIELKEDWQNANEPGVLVMARPTRRMGDNSPDYMVALLSPSSPVAEVTITKDRDLYLVPVPESAQKL